jgi:hypothetical protein
MRGVYRLRRPLMIRATCSDRGATARPERFVVHDARDGSQRVARRLVQLQL